MKPLRLTMQAFGPYAELAQVDFRQIIDGGLFLIHGQTGAGKTSILDGICYALFGKSSGSERSAEGMRCDLAKPDLATEVTLEFSLGTKIFRVVRRPRQTLKKLRGEGVTTSNTKGDLFAYTGEPGTHGLDSDHWNLIASGDKKTDAQVIELLGMSEDQFRQVVVLPQGQFRKFLSAGSDDREELLESLFRTSRYRDLSEKLSSEAHELLEKINHQKRAIEATQSSLNIQDLGDLQTTLVTMNERLSALQKDEAENKDKYNLAAERRDQARQASQVGKDLKVFEAKNSDLEKSAPVMAALQKKLDDNKRARPLSLATKSITALEKDLLRLQGSLASETRVLKTKSDELEKLRTENLKLQEQQPEIEKLKTEQINLRESWKRASELQGESEKLNSAEIAYNESENSFKDGEKNKVIVKEQKTAADAKLKALNETTKRVDSLKAEKKLLESQISSLEELRSALEKIDTQISQTIKEKAAADAIFQKESNALKKLKLKFHLAQAASLAAELKDGLPCPVCGSLDHPKPATTKSMESSPNDETDGVSVEVLEVAEEKSRTASDLVSSLGMKQTSLLEQAEALRTKLKNALTAETDSTLDPLLLLTKWRERLKNLNQEALAVDSAQKEHEATERLYNDLEKRFESLENLSKKLQQEREEKRVLFESLRSRTEQLLELLPADLRNPEAIRLRGLNLKEKLDQYNGSVQEINRLMESAIQATTSAQANLNTLNSEFNLKSQELSKLNEEREKLLAGSGFDDLTEALNASLEDSDAQKIESEKRQLDNEKAIVNSRLSELKAQFGKFPEWALDLEARESEFLTVDQERANQKAEHMTLQGEIEKLQLAQERLSDSMKELTKLEENYKVIGKLAGVANGNPTFNLARVNFPRYVLATRLDDVLDQASRRLFQMSRGQFILKRARTLEDKRKNAGLDLEVEDSFTGTSRPTSSLSGGEGFLASLALALGLADVVQSRLGGVRLEAVFVDEGFGSLDPEALDLAMKTLSELQSGGRLVGVISHVPEMKEQIARRLVVRKTAEGSQVRWEGFQSETQLAL